MKIELLAHGLGFTEGPVALPDGRVALTSISHGCVYVLGPDGQQERIETGGGPNGLTAAPDGTLYVAQNGGIWGGSSKVPAGVQVIADGRVDYLVDGLGAPNDLMFGPDGRLWVTDTMGEFAFDRPQDGTPGQVFSIDVGSGAARLELAEGPVFLNGLAFSPDGTELFVTATLSAELLGYRVTDDGLVDRRLVTTFRAGANPDGMVLVDGGLWIALLAGDRIDLVDLDGATLDSVALPQGSLPTNVCVDHAGTGLYVSAGLTQSLLHLTPG